MSRPRLYVFTVSHFCEKARWAIEHKAIDYELVTLLPGPHRFTVPKIAKSSRVPVLVDGARVIQDSGPILDYLEQYYPDNSLTPTDSSERQEVLHWEKLLDVELGERARRYVYWHALGDPRFVLPLYVQGGPWWGRPFYALMLPTILKAIKGMYGVTEEAALEDLERLNALFARLDEQLGTRRFLVGDAFTRADLTLAALAGPLVLPENHPVTWPSLDRLPPAMLEQTRVLRASRTAERVRVLYREHRAAVPAKSAPEVAQGAGVLASPAE